MTDLFSEQPPWQQSLGPGVWILHRAALAEAPALISAAQAVIAAAPLRQWRTPGGRPLSVTSTNCGTWGWVSDARGYRYSDRDPDSGQPWPALPTVFAQLARRSAELAGYADFQADACLINSYRPGARMGLHQDRDEQDFSQPIVSVSLGLPAVFAFGGAQRSDPCQRVLLEHGDIVVWGGPARRYFHGIQPLKPGWHPLLGDCRLNLTLRRAY